MNQQTRDQLIKDAMIYEPPKIDKAHKKRLDWFFDFLRLDLDGCTDPQFLNKLCIDWVCGIKAKYTKRKISHTPDEQNFLNEQGEQIAKDIVKKVAKHQPDFLIYNLPLKEMQRELKEKSSTLFDRIEGKYKSEISNEKTINGLERGKARYGSAVPAEVSNLKTETMLQVRIDDTGTPRIETAYMFPDDITAITYIFYQEIDNIPLDAFKRCDECGNWFLQLSKKEKNFCSDPCMNRKRQRDIRKQKMHDNPEGYERDKKNSRKRARSSYVNKVKENIGEHAKPARRPRKKKED